MEIVVGLPRDPRSKIVDRAEAAARTARWTEVGRRVVFTNGCFDLLHQGHARYLAAARRLGDALVVGINDDASVRRLKGEKRPLLPEDERAELIASLECVDLVVLFPEDDPGALIAALKPRVLVKGADWPKEKVIGRETVEGLGGEVKSIPLVEGRSTTQVIEEILKKYR
jgi:rfaE bifunctional protein nucleotidyltransferase chain/domain